MAGETYSSAGFVERAVLSVVPDGQLNVSYNALDRHVEAGRGEQAALLYDSPVTGTRRILSYRSLRDEVALFAGVLAGLGVGKGDLVLIYMPMMPQAVIAMLACARLGAVHSVVFGWFAPREIAARIDDAKPSVIVSTSCGVEGNRLVGYLPTLNRAIEMAEHRPHKRVIVQHHAEAVLGPDDINWTKAMASATPVDPVTVKATDPLYILHTSGTTGKPKGVVRDSGGYAVALMWTMRNVYDIGSGETIFTASDIGWVVGHSYAVYAPLLAGATTVLYEGDPVITPDAGQFWRVAVRVQGEESGRRASSNPIHQKKGSARRPAGPARPVCAEVRVPGRRALGSRDLLLDNESAREAGDRPLVAD